MQHTNSWSFVIITNGQSPFLSSAIESIHNQFRYSDNLYEIIIVGGHPSFDNFVVHIPFDENIFYPSISLPNIRRSFTSKSLLPLFFRNGALSIKKNIGAMASSFENICFMHDYISLDYGWLNGFNSFSQPWVVCMNIIYNKDRSRYLDWLLWDHPLMISNGSECPCLIPYDYHSHYMYISGTYFCCKRSFFLENPFDNTLFLGEGEDIEWSKRVRQKTDFVMNLNSSVSLLKQKSLLEPPYCQTWVDNRTYFHNLRQLSKL